MRSIVEDLGLDWSAQYRRIMRHAVLATCVAIVATQVPGDDQKREQLLLPISMLHGWLFGVTINKTRPELRERLTEYQAECFAVLDAYWRDGVAVNPRIHAIADDEPWNCAGDGKSIGRRFAEERQRWERKHNRSLAGVAGFTKQKLRAIEEFDGAIDRGTTQRILVSLGFDLLYIFFGERTLTDAERELRDAYRLGDADARAAMRRHGEAVRITRATDGDLASGLEKVRYAGAESPYYRLLA